MKRGRTFDSSSYEMFVKQSRKRPPASIPPSPMKVILKHFTSLPFFLKLSKLGCDTSNAVMI